MSSLCAWELCCSLCYLLLPQLPACSLPTAYLCPPALLPRSDLALEPTRAQVSALMAESQLHQAGADLLSNLMGAADVWQALPQGHASRSLLDPLIQLLLNAAASPTDNCDACLARTEAMRSPNQATEARASVGAALRTLRAEVASVSGRVATL